MRQEQLLVLLSAAASSVCAADTPPRGVGPEFVSFYKSSTGSFKCISNPAVQLDFDQVNDDFCDCPDGSDEPGTSACAHLSKLSPQDLSAQFTSKPALPGFYCENKGHRPSYIPFTHVNDGICDYEQCCDGSEEYSGTGKDACPNKCKEIGDEWRKHDEARQKSLNAAVQKRRELMKQAEIKRKEMTAEIDALKTAIDSGEIQVKKLTRELADLEAQEAKKATAKVSKVQSLIDTVKPKMSEYRDIVLQLQNQRDAHLDRIKQLELILDDLHKSYNPNFNDEGVKRVVKDYQDYKAEEKDSAEDSQATSDFDSKLYMIGIEGDDAVAWDSFTSSDDDSDRGGISAIYDLQQYLPASAREWIAEKLSDLRDMLADNGIIAHRPPAWGSNESKPVREARQRLDTSKADLEKQKTKKKENEDDLTKDYGIKDVLRPLKGKCISLDAGEYTYEMCWMQKVEQKSKKGGMGSQDMGSFVKYQTLRFDEELPADGKGVGSGDRLALKYEDGAHCWNGPDRSTTVVLACAENEEVWKVTEEEKCVYRMIVGTPAVCDDPGDEKDSAAKVRGGKAPSPLEHDEL